MNYFTHQLENEFKNLSWDQVYSFIEFFLLQLNNFEKPQFESQINTIFCEEGIQYRVINGQVVSLLNQIEADEISLLQDKESTASVHIDKAVRFFSMRPVPDYSNSIKESISAVESIAREITGDVSLTLSDAAKKMKLHPSLEMGIVKIYAWTSDEGGIRHAGKNTGTEPSETEARYILVTCAALVNYLTEKSSIKN